MGKQDQRHRSSRLGAIGQTRPSVLPSRYSLEPKARQFPVEWQPGQGAAIEGLWHDAEVR